MLLMNDENAINVKPETVSAQETEISQADLIELLQKENQELAHQLADTRYKLNQVEIEYKSIRGQLKRTQATLDSHKTYYEYFIDKILDRVNRND